MRAATVHGVLWRLTPRDRVGLDAWENIAGGSYRAANLPMRRAGRRQMSLVYLARRCRQIMDPAGNMSPPLYRAELHRRDEDLGTYLTLRVASHRGELVHLTGFRQRLCQLESADANSLSN